MPLRHLPVRPDLDQLKHQAQDLLRAIQDDDPDAIAELHEMHPEKPDPADAQLADVQMVLARSYQAPSWMRLVQSCQLIDAIWQDDVEVVRDLVRQHPELLRENAGIGNGNWGPPLTYAANLGRDRIITMLHEMGATDLGSALDRAALQGQIGTARMLHTTMGKPVPPSGSLGGPAYSLSAEGTALLFELGASVRDANGKPNAPVDVVLQTDARNPPAKHEILEIYVKHGFELPDTPTMAVHRGRIDLLEKHLRRDPSLLTRTFRHEEIFPPELNCHDEWLPGTSLKGATLLHICIEFEEMAIAQWLLDQGAPVDAPAAVDAEGLGGHTPLFAAVVSFPHFWVNYVGSKPDSGAFARLLLDRGADPNARASMREQILNNGDIIGHREHRNLTPIAWGEVFHNRLIVSRAAMRLIAERGGHA